MQAGFTSANFFSVMGVAPTLGRVFDDREEIRREPVAVLSSTIWERYFGGKSGVLGKTIEVDGRPFTIIGVMPRTFQFPARETMLWLPITTNRYYLDRPKRDNLHAQLLYAMEPGGTPASAANSGDGVGGPGNDCRPLGARGPRLEHGSRNQGRAVER